jgi:hypothetical protein
MTFGLLTFHVISAVCLLIAIRSTAKPKDDALEVMHSAGAKWLGNIGMGMAGLALLCSAWVGITAGLSVSAWLVFFVHGIAMLGLIALIIYWLAIQLL